MSGRLRHLRLPVLLMLAVVLTITGCSRELTGMPTGDPDPPLVHLTKDQFGIRAGLDDAPVQLELYTEPQCSHCADLQEEFGDQFGYYIGTGRLALTYRPLTFLDDEATRGHSGRVVNALFEAATPGGAEGTTPITGRQFQRYVEALWANQERGTPGPTNAELAELARSAGIPELQAGRIEQGATAKTAEDLTRLEDHNFESLYQIDPVNTGTPTVFDLTTGTKIDTYDDDWLAKVMES